MLTCEFAITLYRYLLNLKLSKVLILFTNVVDFICLKVNILYYYKFKSYCNLSTCTTYIVSACVPMCHMFTLLQVRKRFREILCADRLCNNQSMANLQSQNDLDKGQDRQNGGRHFRLIFVNIRKDVIFFLLILELILPITIFQP